MLTMMFFYDGKLSDIVKSEIKQLEQIDAGDGYSNNMAKLHDLIADEEPYYILTNQVALLDNTWLWDTETHRPKLCLRDSVDKKWKPVGRFTKQNIINLTNIEKMVRNGEFTKRAMKRKPEKVPKELIKFKVDG